MKQNTSHLLMIAPSNFGFNEEAFITNKFQVRPDADEQNTVQDLALKEFNDFVKLLKEKGVEVTVYKDFPNSTTPDSIFPNNWISTHQTGELITYPMAVSNRRSERRADIINDLKTKFNYTTIDFSKRESEQKPKFLEGTGSMIFDHSNKIIYGAISPRTDKVVLTDLGEFLDYDVVPFTSFGKTGELIYHTNVMMCVGNKYIIVGRDTINSEDQGFVDKAFEASGKEVIELSNDQVYNHFAGNMIQIVNDKNETILVMSKAAYDSLNAMQLERLNALNDHIISPAIPTIEKIGGGGVRCMIAELFVPAS